MLATLDRLRLTDNTLVVFSSDNGPENTGTRRETDDISTGRGLGTFASVGTTGGHRGRKRSLLQGGIGVPFIAKWPGKIADGKIDDTTPITAVDLLPTFCAIAGAKLPQDYVPDGVNQKATLFGNSTRVRSNPIFWQWKFASKRGQNWPALAVREGGWKLLLGKEPQQVELFRFPTDRLEKNNVRDKQAGEVQRLRRLIGEWQATLPVAPKSSCFSKQRSS